MALPLVLGLQDTFATIMSSIDSPRELPEEIGLWRSPRMRALADIIQEAAHADVTVLITGETGTGKEVAARAIHRLSPRRDAPFVKVNCAAVPRELLESELFGHERGAFTGAYQLKAGKFEQADGGTIFLDEIGDLHPPLQAKLLHVLQDGEFSRIGGRSTIKVDVRVVAATNQDLERACATGRFREDLYYRLNVIPLVMPPLRERAEEIPAFAAYFVRRYAEMYRRPAFSLPDPVLERLRRHRYPGNVRELENIVKRMIVLGDPWVVTEGLGSERVEVAEPVAAATRPVDVLPSAGTVAPAAEKFGTPSLKDIGRRAAREAEREAISRVLEQTGWNRVRAAKLLRISYRALLYKIKEAGL